MVLKELGNSLLNQKARHIPTIAVGLVLLMQERKDLIPMPGSITTESLPVESANAQMIRPCPGLTKSRVLSPAHIPIPFNSCAA